MRVIIALILLALAWPGLAVRALGASAYLGTHLTFTLTAAALVLLARHKPRHPHRVIAAFIGPDIATWVTGHRGDHV